MTIAISISRIAESIYAQSALDAANKGIEVPAALTRKHAKAIERLIRDVAAETIRSLGSAVSATNLTDDDFSGDIITIEYAIDHHEAAIACLRTNIETAIVCGVLARASAAADVDLAKWYESLARVSHGSLPGKIKRYA